MKSISKLAAAVAIPVAVLAAGLAVTSGPAAAPVSAQAASATPTKIAIVNPAKVFNDMQETKDLKTKLENERRSLEQAEQARRQRLQELQDQRNLLKPDAPQFAEKNRELQQAVVEFQVWGQMTKADVERNQKQQMKALYDKIVAATAQVAMTKGYDLVLADQRPEIPDVLDNVPMDQLRLLINGRNVLFASAGVDLTADVTAALDAQYRTQNPGAVAPK